MGGAFLFILLLAVERGIELVIARRNEVFLRSRGGREYGARFSRVLFAFHGLWFLSFALEAHWRSAALQVPLPGLIVLFAVLQAGRYWCIGSLGRFWNTKILVLPHAPLSRRGPYRWLSHPNYLIVRIEIPLYPLVFGCWITALLFGLANLLILKQRIAQEEAALAQR